MLSRLPLPASAFEIIPITPRPNDDTPTVADYAPPYATAQDETQNDNGEISLSRISKAWAQVTNLYEF